MIKLTRKDHKRAPKHVREKLLNEMWHNREVPDDAFADDPRADNFDKHGSVKRGSNSNLVLDRWDMGRFPPND